MKIKETRVPFKTLRVFKNPAKPPLKLAIFATIH